MTDQERYTVLLKAADDLLKRIPDKKGHPMWKMTDGGILVDGKLRPELADFLGQWSKAGWDDTTLVNIVGWMVQTAAKEAHGAPPPTPVNLPTLTWDDRLHPLYCKTLERIARTETDPQELIGLVVTICQNAIDDTEPSVRISELERIRFVTLDADSDVWSVSEAGKLISLVGRIAELTVLLSYRAFGSVDILV